MYSSDTEILQFKLICFKKFGKTFKLYRLLLIQINNHLKYISRQL